MNMTDKLIYMNGSLVLCTIIAFIYFTRKAKLQESGRYLIEKRRKISNKHVFYTNNILTRKRYRRIVMRFSSMACYEMDKIKEESVQLFERAVFTSVLMPVLALITLKHVLFTILVAFVGYIYYDLTVDRVIDKLYAEIVEETSMAVQSIADGYKLTNSIPKAINIAEKGKYLEKPLNQIYEVLTALDEEEALYRFKQTSPIRALGTLATICHINHNNGDAKHEEGAPDFDVQMTVLRQECDEEIRRLTKTRIAFQALAGLALVGLIATPFIDMFLLSQMPGTAVYVQGMYGALEKSAIIGITILAYYLISVLNKPSVVNQVDMVDWVLRLSKNKTIAKFVKQLIPKKFKTRYRLRDLLNSALSSKTLEYIYTAKLLAAVSVFVGVLIFEIGFVAIAKDRLWNNYDSLSLTNTTEMTERMYIQIRQVDKIYMTAEEKMSDEDASKLVKAKVSGLNNLDVENQVDRLSTKWDKYYQLEFKWYYILIAYVAGALAWFSQEASILLRKVMVQFEADQDVMQLQTLLISLSNTNLDTPKVLYWLMMESTVHKAPLHYAYLEYTVDPEMALARLKDSVGNKDLKRLISKLEKTMYSLSVKDAFSDIRLDKEHSLFNYSVLQDKILESKKAYARMASNVPLYGALIFGFVAPILLLGISQLMTAFKAMS